MSTTTFTRAEQLGLEKARVRADATTRLLAAMLEGRDMHRDPADEDGPRLWSRDGSQVRPSSMDLFEEASALGAVIAETFDEAVIDELHAISSAYVPPKARKPR